MPIARDEFEAYDPGEHRTNAERVVAFLAENADRAFTAAEIREATGVADGSIHPVLGRLEEEGVVRHKSPYWALVGEGERADAGEDERGRTRRPGRRERPHGDHPDWPKPAVRRHRPDR